MIRELTTKERNLLKRVLDRKELQQFFFRKVKGLHWFQAFELNGFFKPDSNPKPLKASEEGFYSIPPWLAVDYLVSTGEELSLAENEKYAKKTVQIIRDATNYAISNSFSNYRTWWQFAKIIRSIPLKFLSVDDAELFSYWLKDPFESGLIAEEIGKSWIPKLLDSNETVHHEIAIQLINKIFEFSVLEKNYDTWSSKNLVFRFRDWHAEKIVKEVPSLCGKRLGEKGVIIFEKKVDDALDALDKNDWSSVWRSAIEDHEQNIGSGAEHQLIDSFRDALNGYVSENPKESKAYLASLLESDSIVKKRTAIYVIDIHFSNVSDLLEKILSKDFLDIELRHEMWHLLKNHFGGLSVELKEKILQSIFALEGDHDDPSIREKRECYHRASWLAAIKDHDIKAQEAYKKCVEVAGDEPDHPDFTSYFTSTTWQGRPSPIPIESLISMHTDVLIDKLKRFENPPDDRSGGVGDLANSVKEVFKAKPNEMVPHLSKFLDLDIAYIHNIIQAYRELWNESKDAQWESIWPDVLDFIKKVIAKEHFWADEAANPRGPFTPNRKWVVGEIAELIEAGTKSDKHAFDIAHISNAKEILLHLLDNQKGEEDSGSKDPVMAAINSPKGKLIEALVNLTLRACRHSDKNSTGHHDTWLEFQGIYERLLGSVGENEYEFQTLFAMYLPNFLYMSKNWTCENLGNLFDKTHRKKWLCAINGYAYVNAVHEPIYKWLKANGDFITALDEKDLDERVQEKIIQSICVSYWTGFEDFESGSLIEQLLSRRKKNELNQLIWFMWTLRGHQDPKLKEKVLRLWPMLIEMVDPNTKDGRSLASRLCKWSAFVDELNPLTTELLSKIAPFANEEHNSYLMLESLARLSESQPFEVQAIMLKMLDSFLFDYPEDAIKKILSNLVSKGPDGRRKALEVTDQYIKHGLGNPSNWLNEILNQE